MMSEYSDMSMNHSIYKPYQDRMSMYDPDSATNEKLDKALKEDREFA